MQEDLIIKLADFGLTVNQAKVYLSIVQSGSIPVCKISKVTQLHRQDIYKILPKLEKMGLTTKTIDNPFIIQANPVETAIKNLIFVEKDQAKKRILRLDNIQKELAKISKNREIALENPKESQYILLTNDTQIKNKTDSSYQNAKLQCDLVTNLELITPRILRNRELLRILAKNNVKTRLIIENKANEKSVKKTLESIKPDNGNFAAKLIIKAVSIPYQIIDRKELWICKREGTESGHPCVLWTNGKNMVRFYQENFNRAWESRQAITIYPQKDALEEKIYQNIINQ